MKKKILFRADGNSKTGLGHLYRMFALVEMYKDKYDYIFITKENSTVQIIPKSYIVHLIPNDISIKDEPHWLSKEFNASKYIIIADGYQFVSSYQKQIKEIGYTLMYIDDLATEFMYADIIVNHTPGVLEDKYKTASNTKFALGTNYAILRPSFLKSAKKKLKTRDKIDTAFVCFGGADSLNLSEKTIIALLKIQEIKKIHVVFGAAFNKKKLDLLKHKYSNKTVFYNNLSEKKLLKLMKQCNFAIAPSSTILFELFCVKMPIYSGYFVENQKQGFIYYKNLNAVGGFGDFRKINDENYHNSIQNFIALSTLDLSIEAQKKLIDGKSTSRFRKLLKKYNA